MQVHKIMINGQKLLLSESVDRVNWRQPQVDRFAAKLTESGLSLRKVAEKAGVAHSYIDKLRSRPCKAELKELSRVLDAMDLDIYDVFEVPSVRITAEYGN